MDYSLNTRIILVFKVNILGKVRILSAWFKLFFIFPGAGKLGMGVFAVIIKTGTVF